MVLFYGHRSGEYACFSSWYPAEFMLDEYHWSNSEQAYVRNKNERDERNSRIAWSAIR